MPLPAGVSAFLPGTAVAAGAAVLFAVGSVLQHEAASSSAHANGLELRLLVTRPKWMVGQGATVLGTLLQVVALALAPVAIVQPVLAGGLVVALAIRSVRDRCLPSRLDGIGAACTCGGLAVFLVAARPAAGTGEDLPPWYAVVVAVLVAAGLAAVSSRIGRGPRGALACGASAGIAAGVAAVLISAAVKTFGERGPVHTLAGSALWAALAAAVIAQLGSQQAYARGALSWSMPALVLLDPLAAVPAARLLTGERLEPGHAFVWVPAAAVAVVGVVLLARTGEGCRRPLRRRRRQRVSPSPHREVPGRPDEGAR
ncbi:DMT family transporter [Amycolatopsis vastitatis]|uniref:DMT family transporter n=1 Tax=Amycolatopsis vastitatis TaxID=1905142 RepID=UPI00142E4EE0|nr:DMT family transporter [Amycolatopsis vastitatis]